MDVGTDVVIVEEQGVTVRALRRPGDDRVLHGVIDEAFDTWPDRDSRTGALGLYEHVGMAVTESFARYSLELS